EWLKKLRPINCVALNLRFRQIGAKIPPQIPTRVHSLVPAIATSLLVRDKAHLAAVTRVRVGIVQYRQRRPPEPILHEKSLFAYVPCKPMLVMQRLPPIKPILGYGMVELVIGPVHVRVYDDAWVTRVYVDHRPILPL